MDYLSDLEIDKIEAFNSDTVLVEAVKKVLLASAYQNGTLRKDVPADPTKNAALGLAFLAMSGRGVVSNADLGEDLRGLAQGIQLVEAGFKKLTEVKRERMEAQEEEANEAI